MHRIVGLFDLGVKPVNRRKRLLPAYTHPVFADKDPTENLHNGDILISEYLYSAPELPKAYRELQTLSQRSIVIGLFDFEDLNLAQKIISEKPI